MALTTARLRKGRRRVVLVVLGVFASALIYGDGVLTPAISVLSAVEGLAVVTPSLSATVVPVTIVILVAIFSVQLFGTAAIGRWFGPIMNLWFVALAALGIRGILLEPQVLWAISPLSLVHWVSSNGWSSLAILGAVFLVVTGAEALYADLGHFGERPIRTAWFAVAFPALALN